MPGLRARPLMAAAVAVVAAVGSLSAGGTSSASSAATSSSAPTYGPVPLPMPAQPLVDVHGPLLPVRPPAATAPLGPWAGPAEVGPPVVVGPDSPVARIRTVQRLLNARGAQLRVDGAWGPATTRAVLAVQADAGLPLDGRAGPRTLAVLRDRDASS